MFCIFVIPLPSFVGEQIQHRRAPRSVAEDQEMEGLAFPMAVAAPQPVKPKPKSKAADR